MNNRDRDIYQLLNEVKFDVADIEEIEVDEVSKRRINNKVLNNIKRRKMWNSKWNVIVAALLIVIVTLISPLGKGVIAQIQQMFIFNPGFGVVNVNKEINLLSEPIGLNIDGREVIIKGIVSEEKYLSVDIWIGDKSLEGLSKEEIEKKDKNDSSIVQLVTSKGEEINLSSYSKGGGGTNTFLSGSFETDKLMEEVTLKIFGEKLQPIKLTKAEELKNLNSVGGNAFDNGLILGGNKYSFNKSTYINLWSDQEYIDNGMYYIGFDKKKIEAFDTEGKKYEVKSSPYSGTGKEFVIEESIASPIELKVTEVLIFGRLKEPISLKLNIPKKGESSVINKEIYIPEFDEKIILKTIRNTEKAVEVIFDTATLRKDNTDVFSVNAMRSGYCTGASTEDRRIIYGVYHEDLTTVEKLSGKLNLELTEVDVMKYGEWKFTIE